MEGTSATLSDGNIKPAGARPPPARRHTIGDATSPVTNKKIDVQQMVKASIDQASAENSTPERWKRAQKPAAGTPLALLAGVMRGSDSSSSSSSSPSVAAADKRSESPVVSKTSTAVSSALPPLPRASSKVAPSLPTSSPPPPPRRTSDPAPDQSSVPSGPPPKPVRRSASHERKPSSLNEVQQVLMKRSTSPDVSRPPTGEDEYKGQVSEVDQTSSSVSVQAVVHQPTPVQTELDHNTRITFLLVIGFRCSVENVVDAVRKPENKKNIVNVINEAMTDLIASYTSVAAEVLKYLNAAAANNRDVQATFQTILPVLVTAFEWVKKPLLQLPKELETSLVSRDREILGLWSAHLKEMVSSLNIIVARQPDQAGWALSVWEPCEKQFNQEYEALASKVYGASKNLADLATYKRLQADQLKAIKAEGPFLFGSK